VLKQKNPGTPVPIDLVTTSASGFDPDITPASAEFQVPRVARARGLTEDCREALVQQYTSARQFGFSANHDQCLGAEFEFVGSSQVEIPVHP